MKTPLRTIEEWTGHRNPDPSPWKGLGALVLLGAVVSIGFLSCSCAQLNSIPFSVSYHDPIGGVVTFDKPAVIIPSK